MPNNIKRCAKIVISDNSRNLPKTFLRLDFYQLTNYESVIEKILANSVVFVFSAPNHIVINRRMSIMIKYI